MDEDLNPGIVPSVGEGTSKISWRQYGVTFVAVLGGMVAGTALGWSGPALSILDKEGHFDSNMQNWIACILPLGAVFGGPVGSFLIGLIGRRSTMMINSAVYTLTYLIMVCASEMFILLLVGRFLCGIAAGISTVAVPIYVSEVVSKEVRGMFGFGFQIFITIGILFIYIVGSVGSLEWLSTAPIFLSVIRSMCLLAVPESPVFLLKKRRRNEAQESLMSVRGHSFISAELDEIQTTIDAMSESTSSARKDILLPWNLKPLLVALFLMFGQQFSGINAILFNSFSIFQAAKTGLSSFVASSIVASVMIVATVIAALIVDRLGRRFFLLVSGFLMSVSITALAGYFYVQKEDPSFASSICFVPLVALSIYIFFFNIGFGPIPWLMMSELFAHEVRSLASSLVAVFNWSCAFAVTTLYNPLQGAIGKEWTFGGFGVICLVVSVISIFVVPETKGRSLEEIQQQFRGPLRADNDNSSQNGISNDTITVEC